MIESLCMNVAYSDSHLLDMDKLGSSGRAAPNISLLVERNFDLGSSAVFRPNGYVWDYMLARQRRPYELQGFVHRNHFGDMNTVRR